MTKVYRLENEKGFGPFNAFILDPDLGSWEYFELLAFSNVASNEAVANGIPANEDGIMNRITPEYKFAAPSLELLHRWFPYEVLELGKTLGFRICEYDVPDTAILHSNSGTQVAFNRFNSVKEVK